MQVHSYLLANAQKLFNRLPLLDWDELHNCNAFLQKNQCTESTEVFSDALPPPPSRAGVSSLSSLPYGLPAGFVLWTKAAVVPIVLT